jgi:hypothetical protein
MLRRVALVRTDVSEERSASFIRVRRIGELETIALFLVHRILSPWWRNRYVPPKRRFLQEPRGETSQKTPFFIVTAVKPQILHISVWSVFVEQETCPIMPVYVTSGYIASVF